MNRGGCSSSRGRSTASGCPSDRWKIEIPEGSSSPPPSFGRKPCSEEDSSSACDSDGLGNCSDRDNMKPFDIFLEKKGTPFTLKPPLLAQNRERRNAVKKSTVGHNGVVLRSGMVLLKNFLSMDDQVVILKTCRQLGLDEGGFYQPGYRDGANLRLKMMCLGKNWDPETCQYGDTRPVDGAKPPKIPLQFNRFVERAIKESQTLIARNSKRANGEDGIPSMSADLCIVNFYTSTGQLGLHQDKDESEESLQKGLPVVSFSIGDSAEFLYGDQRDVDRADKVVLDSGDVLLFGGKARKVFHGVKSILPNTAPKTLLQLTDLRPGRLNLTFRQY
ncbi:PREDICTED: alpha-ketoglutarate-dependent dioxygenase abh1-like [Tarenaya hassleriana]|uniref:alpha-ketoglutarate-dependent dioxygenase abh1-like n=1 Tax=Tarenaya hassleriana TaxID=28532 RepID=UPI00053C4AD3|nr:PREDICTED: alpha-ketoglutarate-dependent dioxygenase abh1-like [Tarenaya hassleriana]